MAKRQFDWDSVTRLILERIDVRREYEQLGIAFRSRANAKGWIEVDGNRSARVNLGDGVARGRYHDFGGDGLSCTFFDFCVRQGKFQTWQEARRHYAHLAGVELPTGLKPPKDPGYNFRWKDWNDLVVAAYCEKKPPIDPAIIKLSGARIGQYGKGPLEQPVIALPQLGPHLLDDDPVGWIAVNRTGGPMRTFNGKGVPPKESKTITPKRENGVAVWAGTHGAARLANAEVVWKVEGVTDMWALMTAISRHMPDKLDTHIVLTNCNGCNEIPNEYHAASLAGKIVYVIHDADKPGQGIAKEGEDPTLPRGGNRWCLELAKSAKEVRFPQLPYLIEEHHGKDVRDFFAEGHSYQELLQIAAESPVIKPRRTVGEDGASASDGGYRIGRDGLNGHNRSNGDGGDGGNGEGGGGDGNENGDSRNASLPGDDFYERRALEVFKIDVWGERSDGSIEVCSLANIKRRIIKDVDRMTAAKFIQFFGSPAKEHLNESDTDMRPAGMFRVEDVRRAIALFAGRNPITDEEITGAGVWCATTREGDEKKSVVLVGKQMAARWNGDGKLHQFTAFRDGGRKLAIDEGEAWFDYQTLKSHLENYRSEWGEAVTAEAIELFGRWTWRHQRVDPWLMTGLVLASWVQTLWRWRPHVSITGETNTGKTVLLDTLEKIFWRLAARSAKPTAAGIRQRVKQTAKVIMADEFEYDRHRQEVLEMARLSSRGDAMDRGTPGQNVIHYSLHHIFWVAATETGLRKAPDLNRFIKLDLMKPRAEDFGKLAIPSDAHLRGLGQKLLAVAIHSIHEARQLADALRCEKYAKVDQRMLESYAVPAAILAVALNQQETAKDLLTMLLAPILEAEQEEMSDQYDLLSAILRHVVRVSSDVERTHWDRTIAELIGSANFDDKNALERNGLATCYKHRGAKDSRGVGGWDADYLFVDCKNVAEKALRGTDWERQAIDVHLEKIPGAEKTRRVVAGRRAYGVMIPMGYIKERHLACEDEEAGGRRGGEPEPF